MQGLTIYLQRQRIPLPTLNIFIFHPSTPHLILFLGVVCFGQRLERMNNLTDIIFPTYYYIQLILPVIISARVINAALYTT